MCNESYQEALDRLASTQDVEEATWIIITNHLSYNTIKIYRPDDYNHEEVKRDLIVKSFHASDDFLVDILHKKVPYQELCANHGQAMVDDFVKRFHDRLHELGIHEGVPSNAGAMVQDNGHLPTSTNSLESNKPKKSLKNGFRLATGRMATTVMSFHFLKEKLQFFLDDLPFTIPLPPTEPQFNGSAYYHLKRFRVGVVTDDVRHHSKNNMHQPVPGNAIHAIAKPDGFVLCDSDGVFVEMGRGTALSYGVSELGPMAHKKWVEYSKTLNDAIDNFEAEIAKYSQDLADWEWTVFCMARDVADQVHWARDVTVDRITQATKETGLKPIFTPKRLLKELQDAKFSMYFVENDS